VWGPQLVHYKSDPSRLSVVDEAILAFPGGRLQVLATYWPFPPASTTIDHTLPDLSAPLRRGLYHRLAQYLHSQGSTDTPLAYARDTIQHWVQRHVSTPGHHPICGGDFNSLWDPDGGGGGGYRSPLRDWALGIGLRSRRDDLLPIQYCVTRPSTQLTGGSEIDHVLYNSPNMRLLHYSTGTDGLWVGLSDHRPILVGFSPLPLAHLQATPRFNKKFGDLKRLQIKRFAPSAPQLQNFHLQLHATWRPLPAPPVTSFQAEQQLDHLTQITLDAAPDRKKWKKRNRFKEHWSPTYAALQPQLRAMLKLQRHLGVLPLPPHWQRWCYSDRLPLTVPWVSTPSLSHSPNFLEEKCSKIFNFD